MKIQSLYFKNGYLGWEVKPIDFQNLNLLVGLSGAGKSQIINALWQLRGIALGKMMNNVEWHIKFSIGLEQYEWKGKFAIANFDKPNKIKTESLRDSKNNYIERREDGFIHTDHPTFGTQTTNQSTTSLGFSNSLHEPYLILTNHFDRQ